MPAHVIDKAIPTAGLAIPQAMLAQWGRQIGVQLQPLVDALKAELLAFPVQHADETPIAMLDPGAGKRAAVIMSLIRSACLNGHEPFAYFKEVLTGLPTQPQSRIGTLLAYR